MKITLNLATGIAGTYKTRLDAGFLYIFSGPVPDTAGEALDVDTGSGGDHIELVKISLDGDGVTGLTFDTAGHPHERQIARAILERCPELWLYRADQRRACGDLVVVDVSARAASRACAVLELKQRVPLREVSPAHVQLAAHPRALDELVEAGVLDPSARALTLLGTPSSPAALRAVLRAATHERGSSRRFS